MKMDDIINPVKLTMNGETNNFVRDAHLRTVWLSDNIEIQVKEESTVD